MACTVSQPCPTPNITTLQDMFMYPNQVTDGAFGFALVLMIFFVCYISMRKSPMEQALPASLFISLMMATLLSVAGIVSQAFVFLILIATIAATVLLNVKK